MLTIKNNDNKDQCVVQRVHNVGDTFVANASEIEIWASEIKIWNSEIEIWNSEIEFFRIFANTPISNFF